MQKIFDSPTKQWEVSVAMSVIDNFPLFVFDILYLIFTPAYTIIIIIIIIYSMHFSVSFWISSSEKPLEINFAESIKNCQNCSFFKIPLKICI